MNSNLLESQPANWEWLVCLKKMFNDLREYGNILYHFLHKEKTFWYALVTFFSVQGTVFHSLLYHATSHLEFRIAWQLLQTIRYCTEFLLEPAIEQYSGTKEQFLLSANMCHCCINHCWIVSNFRILCKVTIVDKTTPIRCPQLESLQCNFGNKCWNFKIPTREYSKEIVTQPCIQPEIYWKGMERYLDQGTYRSQTTKAWNSDSRRYINGIIFL